MAIIRHMRRSVVSVGRPGGLIREIAWKGNRNAKNICRYKFRKKTFYSKKNCPWGS